MKIPTLGTFFLFMLLLVGSSAKAENHCETKVGRFISIEGDVEVERQMTGWRAATMALELCEADTIRVGENSRAAIQLVNNSVLRLDQGTLLRLVDVSGDSEEWAWLDLGKGAIYSFTRTPWRVKINTPFFKGLIKGTEFYVKAESERSRLMVFEGQVSVENKQGQVTVTSGQEAYAQQDKAPSLQLVVHPRDAVQWSLYYPPVLLASDGAFGGTAAVDLMLQKALRQSEHGQTVAALKTLEQTSLARHDSRYLLARAALLLSAGRSDRAEADINQAIQASPSESQAYALRAMIALVQNRQDRALVDAEKAVSLQRTVAAFIALSYAQQAGFKLDAARETLLTASTEYPYAPLVWARLGELELMLGNYQQALDAARQAAKLAPDSAHAMTILGFCALAEFRTDDAKSAFMRAISLSSANPMPHLGLGLAEISAGELIPGRREIEAAVALDSNSAVLRSYLGKAYFTEKRSSLDATQFRLAKALDPHDPTAYLYDGIRKQSENKPIEALYDLQKSQAFNDNRAVYRSRMLLDKDRASKGISLARVYKDLGFNTLGQREASVSLEDDPANASAHRFLSDSYQGVRRREIARVSELLQAQLMQEVNFNPIQPSLAETNLNIFTQGGAATPGFNEFTPLFERNAVKLDANGFGGSNGTFGGEGAVTALYKGISFGASGLHYQSNGWRENNGLNQHLYDFFTQAALTPGLNIQAEYRHRESEEGDLAFNFDPAAFVREKTVGREQDIARFGLRYSPSAQSNLLFSYIHSDRSQKNLIDGTPIDPTTTVTENSTGHDHGDQFEGQYLFAHDHLNIVAGIAHSQVNQRVNGSLAFNDTSLLRPHVEPIRSKGKIDNTRGYIYSHIQLPKHVNWTLGFSYDVYDEGLLTASGFNPKLGLQWDVTDKLRVRGAWLRTRKSALVNNRTIEPTQVAGFNQLFDDINGTRSTRYGGGFDWQLTSDVYWGGEISWRELDEPVSVTDRNSVESFRFESRKETLHSLYLYWTPLERLVAKAEFAYDQYRSQLGVATENGAVPVAVETFSAPLSLGYFDPAGWFFRLGGTFVHQDVRLASTAIQGQGNDSFFLLDADAGYRLPKRWGLASIGVKNLLDTKFRYQDDSYREFRDEPSTGPYFPDRIIMARVVLNF